MNDEGGGVFLTNGLTDICDCIVAFATENTIHGNYSTYERKLASSGQYADLHK